MKKIFQSVVGICAVVWILCLCSGCSKPDEQGALLPELLRGQNYVYDELETGEGTALYTLRFTDTGYYLYEDNGTGVLSYGDVQVSENHELFFAGEDQTMEGTYAGSAFEEPSVTLTYQNRKMCFTPATDTTEYVYLSFLGTFTGNVDGKEAVLILERWFEWYLYTDGKLERGTYEIFADGTVSLKTLDGTVYSGTLKKGMGDTFDLRKARLFLNLSEKSDEQSEFTYGVPQEQYNAAHAMGTYTLSIYDSNLFEIHGVDGFLKAMGTIQRDGDTGVVTYFPREITDHAEEGYELSVSYGEDTYFFPETTRLLPRSGNINEETGFGVYWSAGTKLEFIKRSTASEAAVPATELFAQTAVSGSNHFPDTGMELSAVMPTSGVARPLVLLIDFPDYHRPRHVTAEGMEEALFSLENSDSLSAFYYRSSYGKLTIEGKVYGWYRTKESRDAYTSDSEIMSEAIDYYIKNEGLELADFDADHDGVVDSLYVFWAGNLGNDTGIWDGAYRSTWTDSPAKWDRRITGYIFVPGNTVWSSVPPLACNLNSLVHETGHLLGLNDYYSYDTAERTARDGSVYTGGALEGGLGGMDMMDTNIGDHNVFSKWLLGWADPTVIEYEDIASLDQEYRLRPSALAGDGIFIKLQSSDSLYTELLVIEAVSPVLNAAEFSRLKEPVVRIMHIENSVERAGDTGNWRGFGFRYDNSYTSTKYISIIEADGKDEVLNFTPGGNSDKISYDANDFFVAGDVITSDTYPNTNAYDTYGNASIPTGLCITIEDIEEDGTAVIHLGNADPGRSLELVDIMPAPQVVPYQSQEESVISAQDTRLTFTFSEELAWAEEGAMDQIMVLHNQTAIEGVEATLEKDQLILALDSELEPQQGYTVILPANILAADSDSECRNNFNGIYGFIIQ